MKTKILLGLLVAGVMSTGCVGFQGEIEDEEVDSTQQALISRVWAYAWTQNTTGTFSASSTYTRSSAGDSTGQGVTTTVTQLATGQYQVNFPDIGTASGGNVQVTAYGSGSERCKVNSWVNSGGDVNAYVNCFTAAGTAVNTQFSIAYVRKSGTGSTDEAYVWANNPTSSSYTPDTTYQYNSSGSTNTITRSGTGVYAVTLPGQTALGATVEVTAYGTDSDYCKVGSWSQSGSNTVVNVRCFDTSGAASDSKFTLNFGRSTQINGGLSYSYAWANNATSSSYTPHLSYQKGYIAGDIGDVTTDITAGRSSTGHYSVTLPGMTATGSNVQITAYGTGSEYCKVIGWSASGSATQVNVACYNASGSATDTLFDIVYTDDLVLIL